MDIRKKKNVSICGSDNIISRHYHRVFGPGREKTCLGGLASNKGADQPGQLRSLISAFVIHLLESTIYRLATSKISIF